MPGWRPEELALGIEPEDAECEGMPYGVFTLSGTTPACPINPHCGVRVRNKACIDRQKRKRDDGSLEDTATSLASMADNQRRKLALKVRDACFSVARFGSKTHSKGENGSICLSGEWGFRWYRPCISSLHSHCALSFPILPPPAYTLCCSLRSRGTPAAGAHRVQPFGIRQRFPNDGAVQPEIAGRPDAFVDVYDQCLP